MRAYDRWRRLDRHAKRLTLEAAWFTAIAVVRVTVEGAPRLLRSATSRGHASPRADDLRDLTIAIGRASRYVPGATCLPRAFALTWMLKRRGIQADVRVGVRTDAGTLLAHAWVECQGMALGGPAAAEPFVLLR